MNTLGWINVRDYGATGNGSTDDTAAINAAIAQLNANGRGVLYFPAGTYKVSSGLDTISVQFIVLGDGKADLADLTWGTQINLTDATGILFTTTALVGTFTQISLTYTGAGGGVSGAQTTAGAGILVGGSVSGTRIDFEDISVQDFYIGIDITVGEAWTMRNCQFAWNHQYGVRIQNTITPDAGYWQIDDCMMGGTTSMYGAAIHIINCGAGKIHHLNLSGAGGHGIEVAQSGSTSILIISDCALESYMGDGIHLDGGTAGYPYVMISNIEFGQYGNATGHAVYTTKVSDISISNYALASDGGSPTAFSLNNGARGYVGPGTNNGFAATLVSSSSFTSLRNDS